LLVFYREENHHLFPLLRGAKLAVRKAYLQVYESSGLGKALQAGPLAHIKEGDRLRCQVRRMSLQHEMHLQTHALAIHGTVS
jgi:hypothetical protein